MRNTLIAIVLFSAVGIYVGRDTLDFVTRWTDTPASVETREAPRRATPAWRGVRREYFQFVDAAGNVRFAPSLDEVPPEKRATAGRMMLDRPPPTAPDEAYTWKDGASRADAARARTEAASAPAAQRALPRNVNNLIDMSGVVLFVGPGCEDC